MACECSHNCTAMNAAEDQISYCALHGAAPDLLAALERIASEPCDHGPMPFCPREEARAAIRKAKGE